MFLAPALTEREWGRELARRPGVHVTLDAEQIATTLGGLEPHGPLTAG